MNEGQMQNTVPALSSEGAAHHPYGPSRWPALLECPCFESRPPTENAERGTALHALFESVMRGTYDGDPVDAIEQNVVDAARQILRTVEPTLGRFYIEERVELPGPGGTPSGIYGRLDLAWIDSETLDLHVADLKSSENPDRDYRPQLLAYAAGMARHLDLEGPRNVVLHLIYADSGRITTQTADIGDAMMEYLGHYRRIADIGRGDIGQPTQCGWCDLCTRFVDCAAMKAVVDRAGPKLADAAKPEVWAEFTPAKKAQLCALADTLAKWCVAVKENAAADAKAGVSVEDAQLGIYYGLQHRAGKWTATVDEAWAVLRSTLPREHFTDCLSLSASKLRAKLRAVGKSPKEIEALLEAAGTRGEPSVVFVRRKPTDSAA